MLESSSSVHKKQHNLIHVHYTHTMHIGLHYITYLLRYTTYLHRNLVIAVIVHCQCKTSYTVVAGELFAQKTLDWDQRTCDTHRRTRRRTTVTDRHVWTFGGQVVHRGVLTILDLYGQ